MFRTVVSILFLAAAGGIFFFYTKPSYDAMQALSAQGAQYDQALSKAAQLQSIKQSLLSKYNSFDPNALTRLSTMLPDQVDNIRLILDLDNIAGRYGMALQDVNISAPASQTNGTVVGAITSASQPYDSLTLQFTTHGTYQEFKQFLTDLEYSLRLVDLISLTISGGGTASPSGAAPSYTYSMTLQTYWLR